MLGFSITTSLLTWVAIHIQLSSLKILPGHVVQLQSSHLSFWSYQGPDIHPFSEPTLFLREILLLLLLDRSWSGSEPGSSLQLWDITERSKHTLSSFFFFFLLGTCTPIHRISGCTSSALYFLVCSSASLFLGLLSKAVFGEVAS